VDFFEVSDKVYQLCKEKGELSFAEIERIATAEEIRPSAVLDDIAIRHDIVVDYSKGVIRLA